MRALLDRFPGPHWLDETSLAGKTIILHAEQGLGDTIQACRFAILAEQAGARTILMVPPALSIIRPSTPVDPSE